MKVAELSDYRCGVTQLGLGCFAVVAVTIPFISLIILASIFLLVPAHT